MIDFQELYEKFQSPILELDCGNRCSPHNGRGVPFCCDNRHAVPTAYLSEWDYLEKNTDLWRLWKPENKEIERFLTDQAPPGQVLITCQGHLKCQRAFRSIDCRCFPFFPYITLEGNFIGLSYYWEFEDRCWVISNLNLVSNQYRSEFILAFDFLFDQMPEERETYRHHSILMRRAFGRRRRAIPLLHRNGKNYKLTPRNGRIRQCNANLFSKYGPYKIAADLPFPDELANSQI